MYHALSMKPPTPGLTPLQSILKDIPSLPSRRFQIVNPLGRVFPGRVLVRGQVRIGILALVQVAEGVIHLAVFGFVGPDVQQEITHLALTLGHLPVFHCNRRCFEVAPLGQLAGL